VGLAKALEICAAEMAGERERLRALRSRLLDRLLSGLDGVSVNGDLGRRLDGNLSVAFDGVDGPSLSVCLDGLAVSSGSACASATAEPSHVLTAIGKSRDVALASVRFGIGRFNTEDDVDRAAAIVVGAVRRLRGLGGPARDRIGTEPSGVRHHADRE
jgi:cysteine desulfurase